MAQQISVIDLGGVNCYLVKTPPGFILIDTGLQAKRAFLEKALERAGCNSGNLDLIMLTHGDSDHADNAAYLQKQFGAKIAIHADDAGMVECGDMSWNRKVRPDKHAFIFRWMAAVVPLFVRPSQFEVFTPDFIIDENFSLAEYGFDAQVLHLPGHSKGSIGILTATGDLFCGDFLYNILGRPSCYYIDDLAAFNTSLSSLKAQKIRTIYPGHGKSFLANKIPGN
jgi:hydroxyacylglutathione hydrolase